MGSYRNLTSDIRHPWVGLHSFGPIEPDGVLTVPDELDEHFDCQPEMWGPIPTPGAAPVVPASPPPAAPEPAVDSARIDEEVAS